LLGASGAAGAVAALSGCGLIPTTKPPLSKISVKVERTDVPILASLLRIEYRLAYAYTASLPPLNRSVVGTRLARWFVHQELAHVTAISTLLESAHVKPNTSAGSFRLGAATTPNEVLDILRRQEDAAIRAYQHAIPRLSHGKLRAIAASIMANEGQHISVLRMVLGLEPVPTALVTERE
jgi:hypothetical protein